MISWRLILPASLTFFGRCCKARFAAPYCAAALLAMEDRPAVIGFAKSRGLRIFFRAEPAVRFGDGRITAACLDMIDADIAGDMGADRKFCLDAATGRHRRLLREQ